MNVNDDLIREHFFSEIPNYLSTLSESSRPLWGDFSPQQMVEHLIWIFRGSNGDLNFPVLTPAEKLERNRQFLMSDQPIMKNFKISLLAEGLPALEYPDLASAKAALIAQSDRFIQRYQAKDETIYNNAVFGPLTVGEWHHFHYKHCLHHLAQFDLVQDPAYSS
ncbi:MAG: DinB family protein [Deinococcales bacterium]